MAYRCPVCEEPQVDAGHLANHMAFTAVIRGSEHEDWLDEHTPGWSDEDEAALAARLLEDDAVEDIEHPIDETSDHGHGHAHDHGHGQESGHDPAVEGHRPGSGGRQNDAALDAEARDILEEARELTREMEESEGETE